jgi:hypothetical protein
VLRRLIRLSSKKQDAYLFSLFEKEVGVECEIRAHRAIGSTIKLTMLRGLYWVAGSGDLTSMASVGCHEMCSICDSDRVSGVSFVKNQAFPLTLNSLTV